MMNKGDVIDFDRAWRGSFDERWHQERQAVIDRSERLARGEPPPPSGREPTATSSAHNGPAVDVKPRAAKARGDGHTTAAPESHAAGEAAFQRPAEDVGGQPWPAAPALEIYHGLTGDLVRAIAAFTEAHPIALLASFLTLFGALAGDAKTFHQGSSQRPNLFVVLVGPTSTGRKGTAWSITRQIFDAACPGWEKVLVPGLGSGEGLVGHLKRQEGVDRRALMIETEFGRALRILGRDGSTLSPVLRDAWDGSPLGRTLARESAIVTRHHVAALGQVTVSELREKLTDAESASGFANRFLFLAVRRTRLVPTPKSPLGLVAPYIEAVRRAVDDAQVPGEVSFTAPAAERWAEFYGGLERRPGLLGAITARAEAQVARLALLYALVDRSPVIDVMHLAAAEALWDYAARSARYIFGDSTGNRHADLVLRLLHEEGEMDRQSIKSETGLRLGADLDLVERVLVDLGVAKVVLLPRPDGAGRRRRVLRMIERNGQNGQNGQASARDRGDR